MILDFDATSGREDMDLSTIKDLRGVFDLSHNPMEQAGGDVMISAGAFRLTLAGVEIADLGRDDFLF